MLSFLRTIVVVLALGAAGTLGTASAEPVSSTPKPIPVVYDSDLDFDDASTLAFLCQAHKQRKIELKAVTVVDNGIGTAGRSLTHARQILKRCGLPDVPVADGSPNGVHPAPPEAREIFERVLTGALDDADIPNRPAPYTAAQLIARTVLASPRNVTVLATGPLTNVATALQSDSRVPWKIARLSVMGGAFDVGGNLFGSTTNGFDNTQEVNQWIDPIAADTVYATMPDGRVRIVPLDATNHVLITQEYIDELGAKARTREAKLVHAIVTQPDMPPLIELDIMFWWDALAASSIVADTVTYRLRPVDVVLEGASSGRTVDVPNGTPQLVGTTADGPRFENVFLNVLNGG